MCLVYDACQGKDEACSQGKNRGAGYRQGEALDQTAISVGDDLQSEACQYRASKYGDQAFHSSLAAD